MVGRRGTNRFGGVNLILDEYHYLSPGPMSRMRPNLRVSTRSQPLLVLSQLNQALHLRPELAPSFLLGRRKLGDSVRIAQTRQVGVALPALKRFAAAEPNLGIIALGVTRQVCQ